MDTDLVVRAQNGDQGAFASLTEVIDGRFHGLASGILRDMELAQAARPDRVRGLALDPEVAMADS